MTISIPYPPLFLVNCTGHVRPLTRKDRDFSSEYAPLTTGIINLCFVVKAIVNDINEVVKGFLIAVEEKERDKAAKKIVKMKQLIRPKTTEYLDRQH